MLQGSLSGICSNKCVLLSGRVFFVLGPEKRELALREEELDHTIEVDIDLARQKQKPRGWLRAATPLHRIGF